MTPHTAHTRRTGRPRWLAVALLVAAALLEPSAATAAADDLGLEISTTATGQPAGTTPENRVEIELGTRDAGSASFWLRHTGGEPLAGVALEADLGGHAEVALSVPGQAKDGTFAATPLLRVGVAVSKVVEPGTFRGAIVARKGDTVATLGTLEVHREGTVRIAGAGVTDSEISATTDRAAFSRPYDVVSDDPAARTVELELDPFVGPNGAVATSIHLDGRKTEIHADGTRAPAGPVLVTLPAYGRAALTLSVDLPVEGEYVSAVRLRLPQGRTLFSRTLRLVRSAAATAAFTVDPPANTVVDTLWWWRPTTARLHLAVKENNRAPLDIDEVSLWSLHRVKGEERTEAERGEIRVLLDGKPIDGFHIDRNRTANLLVEIPGLTQVGQLEGTLRLTSGNLKPVERTFTLFVSRSGVVAFVFIALGVVAAALLRWIGTKRGEYAVRVEIERMRGWLREIAGRGPDLAREPSQRRETVIHAIERRLDRLAAMASRSPAADLEAAVAEVRDRIEGPLREWIALLHQADRAGLLRQVDDDLAAVEVYLVRWGSDANELAAAQTQMEAVRTELGRKSLAELEAAIEAQIRLVEDQRGELSGEVGQVDAVVAKLRTALAAIHTDPAAARRGFDEGWREWIALLVEHVSADLPAETDPPAGFAKQSDWAKVRQTALEGFAGAGAESEPPAARKRYRETLHGLLVSLVEALQAHLAARRKALGTPVSGSDDEARLRAMEALEERARDVRAQIAAGHLQAARSGYNRIVHDLAAAERPAVRRKGFGSEHVAVYSALPALDPGEAPLLEPAPAAGAASAPPLREPGGLARFRSLLRWANVGWTALAVLVIGLVGLQVLYLDVTTWGSLRDILIAILWGLGLHTGTAAITTAAVNRFTSVPGADT